jgi:hypothetical protein
VEEGLEGLQQVVVELCAGDADEKGQRCCMSAMVRVPSGGHAHVKGLLAIMGALTPPQRRTRISVRMRTIIRKATKEAPAPARMWPGWASMYWVTVIGEGCRLALRRDQRWKVAHGWQYARRHEA